MSSIAIKPQLSFRGASYVEADWLRCFGRLGHGGLSPDQAIHEATQAIARTGVLFWMMPLALGLWMTKRYLRPLRRSSVLG